MSENTIIAFAEEVGVDQAVSQGAAPVVLGAQAGAQRLTAVLTEAGFRGARVATSTDLHLGIEVRP